MKRTVLFFAGAISAGCSTVSGARPLPQGQHAAGVTLGGAMIDFAGSPLPLPSAVIQGRSGLPQALDRNLEVDYGLNLTALAFGGVGLHGGASWQLTEQSGGIPALTLTERLHVYTNWVDTRKDPSVRGAMVIEQIELTASWAPGQQVLYAGLGDYLDFGNPALWLTPFAGAQLDFGKSGGIGLQLESRWYALTDRPTANTVQWITPGPGAIGATVGLLYSPRAKETP